MADLWSRHRGDAGGYRECEENGENGFDPIDVHAQDSGREG